MQYFSTLTSVLSLMAPHAGGSVPSDTSEEYAQWVLFVQQKYEEASRRGFWRRLLKRGNLSLTADDTEAVLPEDFDRPNGLYILYVDDVDLADPDRTPDDQSIFIETVSDPDDEDFGKWKVTFTEPIESTQTAPIWYFSTPPKPTTGASKILLPGDMVAFGALSEVFRSTNLPGSQDDVRIEYENRLNGYLAMETIPARHDILSFISNPRGVDRLVKARQQYTIRPDRIIRNS